LIELVPVLPEEEEILHNLMQFYIYEFTVFLEIKLEENGKFGPFVLKSYWTEPNLHAYFILTNGEIAGFAMVEIGSGNNPSVVREFFIMRKFYRKGLGKAAAFKLFSLFPGKWSITQVEKNEPARNFWRSTVSDYTGGSYTDRVDDRNRSIQEFTSAIHAK
jgi:predicted acetyltransferase